jgi:hypothetical protein
MATVVRQWFGEPLVVSVLPASILGVVGSTALLNLDIAVGVSQIHGYSTGALLETGWAFAAFC